jgi:hypothetical protein
VAVRAFMLFLNCLIFAPASGVNLCVRSICIPYGPIKLSMKSILTIPLFRRLSLRIAGPCSNVRFSRTYVCCSYSSVDIKELNIAFIPSLR